MLEPTFDFPSSRSPLELRVEKTTTKKATGRGIRGIAAGSPAWDVAQGFAGRLLKEDRLHRMAGFLELLHSADFSGLMALDQKLRRSDQTGYELSIERQLLAYRLGQLDGATAVRARFRDDADRGEHANGIILEGWASGQPSPALGWWRSLPEGNLRASLLGPLVQGILTARGGNWDALSSCLSPVELDKAATPLLDAVLAGEGPAAALDFFQKLSLDYVAANRLGVKLNIAITQTGDLPLMLRWYGFLQSSRTNINAQHGLLIAGDRVTGLLEAIGAAGGARLLENLDNPPEEYASLSPSHRHQFARAWVRASPAAARQWVQTHQGHVSSSAVAFQLAMYCVREDPDAAARWLEYMDENQRSTAEPIISNYRKSKRQVHNRVPATTAEAEQEKPGR